MGAQLTQRERASRIHPRPVSASSDIADAILAGALAIHIRDACPGGTAAGADIRYWIAGHVVRGSATPVEAGFDFDLGS